MEHTGQPTVVLAHTIKGYGLGTTFAGRNATHQMKKLKQDDLKLLRDFLRIPITDEQLEDPYNAPYYHPGDGRPRDRVHAGPAQGARRVRARAAHRPHAPVTLPAGRRYEMPREGLRPASTSPPPWRSSGCSRT